MTFDKIIYIFFCAEQRANTFKNKKISESIWQVKENFSELLDYPNLQKTKDLNQKKIAKMFCKELSITMCKKYFLY